LVGHFAFATTTTLLHGVLVESAVSRETDDALIAAERQFKNDDVALRQ
jgi:hypothetical protein